MNIVDNYVTKRLKNENVILSLYDSMKKIEGIAKNTNHKIYNIKYFLELIKKATDKDKIVKLKKQYVKLYKETKLKLPNIQLVKTITTEDHDFKNVRRGKVIVSDYINNNAEPCIGIDEEITQQQTNLANFIIGGTSGETNIQELFILTQIIQNIIKTKQIKKGKIYMCDGDNYQNIDIQHIGLGEIANHNHREYKGDLIIMNSILQAGCQCNRICGLLALPDKTEDDGSGIASTNQCENASFEKIFGSKKLKINSFGFLALYQNDDKAYQVSMNEKKDGQIIKINKKLNKTIQESLKHETLQI